MQSHPQNSTSQNWRLAFYELHFHRFLDRKKHTDGGFSFVLNACREPSPPEGCLPLSSSDVCGNWSWFSRHRYAVRYSGFFFWELDGSLHLDGESATKPRCDTRQRPYGGGVPYLPPLILCNSLSELKRCRKNSLGPDFVLLLSRKYGYRFALRNSIRVLERVICRPFPSTIPSDEFSNLRDFIVQKCLLESSNDVAVLDEV